MEYIDKFKISGEVVLAALKLYQLNLEEILDHRLCSPQILP